MEKHIFYMQEAIEEAKKAYLLDETPIGAVIVLEDKIIARAYNRRNTDKNSLAHAEIIAINEACLHVGDWRLEDCTIYITLEPCPMCAGAIVQARIPTVVFGAKSPKAGCGGSLVNILQMDQLNHRCEVLSGICEDTCSEILKDYFRKMRKSNE